LRGGGVRLNDRKRQKFYTESGSAPVMYR
jgi:hypothetical protein